VDWQQGKGFLIVVASLERHGVKIIHERSLPKIIISGACTRKVIYCYKNKDWKTTRITRFLEAGQEKINELEDQLESIDNSLALWSQKQANHPFLWATNPFAGTSTGQYPNQQSGRGGKRLFVGTAW